MMRLMAVVFSMVLLSGCAVVNGGVEAAKTVWGSSTRALENARADAITKTYDKGYWDSMRAAFAAIDKNGYEVFKKDEIRGYIVVVGVRGSVNTTEVGIFFVELGDSQTRIEIASLSTNAKRIVSKALFHRLDVEFGLAPPDPEPPVEEDKDASKDDSKK